MTSQIGRLTRALSAVIDHFVMTIIGMICSIPYFLLQSISSFGSSSSRPNELYSYHDLMGPYWYVGLIGLAVYFCKDSFQGRSLAKRMFKLQVVNASTNQPADPVRCVLRDIFIVLWPIEFVVCLINPERRIGDYVAGTKLVVYAETSSKPRVDVRRLVWAFAIAYLCWFIPAFYFF